MDTGSTDGREEMARESRANWVPPIRSRENIGYAHAVNQGYEATRDVYVATIDNDAVAGRTIEIYREAGAEGGISA